MSWLGARRFPGKSHQGFLKKDSLRGLKIGPLPAAATPVTWQWIFQNQGFVGSSPASSQFVVPPPFILPTVI